MGSIIGKIMRMDKDYKCFDVRAASYGSKTFSYADKLYDDVMKAFIEGYDVKVIYDDLCIATDVIRHIRTKR